MFGFNITTRHIAVHQFFSVSSQVEKDFSTNSHSTTKSLKHSSDFESGENVQSLNVVEFKFPLYHIPNQSQQKYAAILAYSV